MIARFLLPVAALLLILMDCGTSYAQPQICNQLNNQLRQLERNGDFRSGQRNAQKANALQADLQNAESEYVRRGCNDAAKAGQQLSRQCQGIARTIIKGRQQLENLSQDVNTASAISQQREAVLQDISRFGCNQKNSNVNVNTNGNRGSLFERLFGGYTQEENPYGDGDIVDDGTQGYDGYYGEGGTVRTVCVRLSDGYFWPISYSTLSQYVSNDAVQCQEQCPGTPVDLYYYSNPGQEEEQMINMAGEQYINLPNAFAYRKAFDMNAVCKPKEPTGMITIAGGDPSAPTPDGANGAIVAFNGADFPLPKPDPRRVTQAVAAPMQVATALNVPLPRPRPGSDDPTVSQAIAQPQATNENRVVTFGDKKVRIVGPDTPYAQVVAAGT